MTTNPTSAPTDNHGHIVRQEAQFDTEGPADSARPTPGPWKQQVPKGLYVISPTTTVAVCHNQSLNGPECAANAALIAEAGTVLHESGRTPRQLLEERDALNAECERFNAEQDIALKRIFELENKWMTASAERDALYEALQALLVLSTTDSHGWSASEQQEKIKQARAALALAKGGNQ